MRLTFQKQLNPIARQLRWFSMAGAAACVLLSSISNAQEEAPGYAPGSVPTTPFSLLEESSPAELGAWTPPQTDEQKSPSDWVPPETPAEVPQKLAVEEASFAERLGSSDASQEDELLISPPDSLEEETAVTEVAQDSDFSESLQTPSMLPLPSSDVIYVDDPQIPGMPEVIGEELIVFDDECFNVDESLGAYEVEGSVEVECEPCATGACESVATEAFVSDGCTTGNCVQESAPRSIINDHFSTQRPKIGADLFGKTVQAGKNIVGRGKNVVGRGKNIVGNASQGNVLGHQRIYTPVRNILGTFNRGLGGNESVHAVGQLTFLSFARDYRTRGRQLAQGVPNLFANGPDEGAFTGVDINYGRRRAGGQGWEMRYIGFDPQQASDVSGASNLVWGGLTPPLNDPATWGGFIDPNAPRTFGLSGIGLGNFSMADIFNDAQNHRVTRDSQFGSFEFNLLRATAGNTRLSCGNAVVELFGGLRGVAFNETMTFAAGATQSAQFPRSAFYSSDVKNSLFGLQIGGRMERQKANGWGFSFGSRVGIYNNRVESRQRAEYVFDDGSRPSPVLLFGENAGQAFDFEGTDNELAFLGELDFGLIYQFRPQTRARFGYRGIVVTNVAIAGEQLEDSLFDVDLIAQPRATGDFIVGGIYFGVDHAF